MELYMAGAVQKRLIKTREHKYVADEDNVVVDDKDYHDFYYKNINYNNNHNHDNNFRNNTNGNNRKNSTQTATNSHPNNSNNKKSYNHCERRSSSNNSTNKTHKNKIKKEHQNQNKTFHGNDTNSWFTTNDENPGAEYKAKLNKKQIKQEQHHQQSHRTSKKGRRSLQSNQIDSIAGTEMTLKDARNLLHGGKSKKSSTDNLNSCYTRKQIRPSVASYVKPLKMPQQMQQTRCQCHHGMECIIHPQIILSDESFSSLETFQTNRYNTRLSTQYCPSQDEETMSNSSSDANTPSGTAIANTRISTATNTLFADDIEVHHSDTATITSYDGVASGEMSFNNSLSKKRKLTTILLTSGGHAHNHASALNPFYYDDTDDNNSSSSSSSRSTFSQCISTNASQTVTKLLSKGKYPPNYDFLTTRQRHTFNRDSMNYFAATRTYSAPPATALPRPPEAWLKKSPSRQQSSVSILFDNRATSSPLELRINDENDSNKFYFNVTKPQYVAATTYSTDLLEQSFSQKNLEANDKFEFSSLPESSLFSFDMISPTTIDQSQSTESNQNEPINIFEEGFDNSRLSATSSELDPNLCAVLRSKIITEFKPGFGPARCALDSADQRSHLDNAMRADLSLKLNINLSESSDLLSRQGLSKESILDHDHPELHPKKLQRASQINGAKWDCVDVKCIDDAKTKQLKNLLKLS